MKKLLATLAVTTLLALSASAQGLFAFSNIGSGFSNPITDASGALCIGAGYSADYIYQVGSLDQAAFNAGTSIAPLGSTPKSFSTLTAGKINGGNQSLAGLGGVTITVQVRAWKNETINGVLINSYALASKTVGAQYGQSALFTIVLADGSTTPPAPATLMTGMNAFQLQLVTVPEPSTIALGVMGLGALLLRRRK